MRQLEISRGPFDIYLPMAPVAKGRPRFTRAGHAYTPSKTRDFETEARVIAKKQFWHLPFSGPIAVDLVFYFKTPTRPKNPKYMITKPDADNVSKAVCDAMNGLCWVDDSQIVDLRIRKLYGDASKIHLAFAELR